MHSRTRAAGTLVTMVVLVAGIVLCTAAAPAVAESPRVDVVFVAPDTFADVRNGYTPTPTARNFYLAELARYIEQRATPRLADGESLEVRVTNVDLAGDYEARHPQTTNIRIVRDVYPARIDLSFRVVDAGGVVVREGTRQLRSTGYPEGVGVPYSSDPLRYEKGLIGGWLEADLPSRGSR